MKKTSICFFFFGKFYLKYWFSNNKLWLKFIQTTWELPPIAPLQKNWINYVFRWSNFLDEWKKEKKVCRAYHKWGKTMNNENGEQQKKKSSSFCNHETLLTISQGNNSRATIIVMNLWVLFLLYTFFMRNC